MSPYLFVREYRLKEVHCHFCLICDRLSVSINDKALFRFLSSSEKPYKLRSCFPFVNFALNSFFVESIFFPSFSYLISVINSFIYQADKTRQVLAAVLSIT